MLFILSDWSIPTQTTSALHAYLVLSCLRKAWESTPSIIMGRGMNQILSCHQTDCKILPCPCPHPSPYGYFFLFGLYSQGTEDHATSSYLCCRRFPERIYTDYLSNMRKTELCNWIAGVDLRGSKAQMEPPGLPRGSRESPCGFSPEGISSLVYGVVYACFTVCVTYFKHKTV